MPKQNLEDASCFFGFTPGVIKCLKIAQKILFLPQHVCQFAFSHDISIAMRMSGGTYKIQPAEIDVLPALPINAECPFWCIFSTPDTEDQVSAFANASSYPILHISETTKTNTVSYEELTCETIYRYCVRVLNYLREIDVKMDLASLNSLLLKSHVRQKLPLKLKQRCHFLTYANEILLESNNYTFSGKDKLLAATTNAPYVRAIIDSALEVKRERDRIELAHGLALPPPITAIVTCPGFYRHLYETDLPSKKEAPLLRKLISVYRRQSKYSLDGAPFEPAELQSPEAYAFIQLYREDIAAYSNAVAIKAANHFVPVFRLPPGVNLVFPDLALLGQSVRQGTSNIQRSRHKQARLFGNIQRKLQSIVPSEFVDQIDERFNRIKLIANAPLEWLPVRGLPLMIRHEVSRIPTTPGNVMSMQTVMSREMTVSSSDFQEILVVRSFKGDDPVRGFLFKAIEALRDSLSKTQVRFEDVTTIEEFCEVVNRFQGMVMIFDGHARSSNIDPGIVMLGDKPIDLYKLRGQIHVPPIVILSSCDTHAIDGSHASVANTFLMLGAITVLGTLLPVNAFDAALFASRLILRIDEYIPMVTKDMRHPLRWSSVVAEMQRMVYVTEQIFSVFASRKLRDFEKQYLNIQMGANQLIIDHDPEWYEKTIALVANEFDQTIEMTRQELQKHQFVDIIKYIQIGNPDQILIDEGRSK